MFVMRILLCTVFISIASLSQVSAQPEPESRITYLNHLGVHEIALEVETALKDLLISYSGFMPGPRREQVASYFSFILTVTGYTADNLLALNDEGVDIAHALTSNNRPLVEQALFADLVVKGSVVSEEWIIDDPEYQIREVKVRVEEFYKGESESEEIVIRQRNGLEYGENPATAAPLEEGNTYLLFLNNPLFRYTLFRETGNFEESQLPSYADRHSIYRHYEMDKKRILWSGYNNRKSKKALEEVRWLDTFFD